MKKELINEPALPKDLESALASGPAVEATWHSLTPISRRDYTTWVESAKLDETRKRRIQRTCENLAPGKRRPCCYAVVPMDLYRALGNDPAAKAQMSKLTPDERRDLVEWVEDSEDKQARKQRIADACAFLAAGKRGPEPAL